MLAAMLPFIVKFCSWYENGSSSVMLDFVNTKILIFSDISKQKSYQSGKRSGIVDLFVNMVEKLNERCVYHINKYLKPHDWIRTSKGKIII